MLEHVERLGGFTAQHVTIDLLSPDQPAARRRAREEATVPRALVVLATGRADRAIDPLIDDVYVTGRVPVRGRVARHRCASALVALLPALEEGCDALPVEP